MRAKRLFRFLCLAALLLPGLGTNFGCGGSSDKPETGTISQPAVGLENYDETMKKAAEKDAAAKP